jgi:hypothetical protein
VERSRSRTLVVVVAIAVWAVVTPFMWRDLRNRPAEQVRGKKWIWWLASTNLSGSAAYYLFGRRHPD